MGADEYFTYITNCVIDFDNKIRKTEEVTIKAFSYIMSNITEVKNQIDTLNSNVNAEMSYLKTDVTNSLSYYQTDLKNVSDITISALDNSKNIIDEFSTINNTITQLQNDIINLKEELNEIEPSTWWKTVKHKLYCFFFYFKIKHQEKLARLAEEQKQRELEEKRKHEEELYKQEQERLKQIQEERKKQEEARKREEQKREQERKQREEQERQKKLKQQQNQIYSILNHIK